jgi:alpha-galactosidase
MHHQVDDQIIKDREARLVSNLMALTKEQRAVIGEMEREERKSNPHVSHTGQRLVLRDMIKDVAKYIRESTPHSREQSLALTNLEQCEMWANKANERGE